MNKEDEETLFMLDDALMEVSITGLPQQIELDTDKGKFVIIVLKLSGE